ncbi:hemolysin III family protein [uncultured Jatrophihabitans sp.]|uniref:PAQR family membrane homeostasis protein TrhA n=1 Tax=uncultured Jatrophihabitans sp. TaxID=1610747 RepID=UPI0035CA6871
MSGLVESPPGASLYDAKRDSLYLKPRLRGWAHLLSFEVVLVLGTLLIASANGPGQSAVAAVYAVSVAGMFGASALYHRGNWGPAAMARLQRLDHLMIFVVIAGTATPPLALCLPSPYSALALSGIWLLTSGAAALRLTRMKTPEWLAGAIFIALGWTAGASVPAVWMHAGVAPAVLFVAGGLLYTVGALAYHRRWPDPIPAVFGYHEVFHTFVCLAAACHFVAIACFLF